MTAYLARAPGIVPPREATLPMLLLRQKGTSSSFAVLIERASDGRDASGIERVPVVVDGREHVGIDHIAVKLATADGPIYFVRSDGRTPIRVDGTLDFQGQVGVVRPDGTLVLIHP